jgi:hypothetical protein
LRGNLIELAVAFIMAPLSPPSLHIHQLVAFTDPGGRHRLRGHQVRVVPHSAGVFPCHRCGRLFFHRHSIRKS